MEGDRLGGFTIRDDDGPEAGLLIHFASREDLLARAGAVFEIVREPQEVVTQREAPKTGTWAQWQAGGGGALPSLISRRSAPTSPA